MKRMLSLAGVMVALFLATPAMGETLVTSGSKDAVLRRGFSEDALYNIHGMDTVDQMTGNLNVAIPLGQPYVSNGSLRYQFKLVYNSNIWDFMARDPEFVVMPQQIWGDEPNYYHAFGGLSVSDLFHWDNGKSRLDSPTGNEAVPPAQMNAGLGWTVTLGDVYGGVVNDNLVIAYVDADGAKHTFFSRLHGTGSGVSEMLSGAGPFYTRDGTYMRMKRRDEPGKIVLTIEMADGTSRKFSACTTCSAAVGVRREWHLDEIADPYGNRLVVTRQPENRPAQGGTWLWKYEEYAEGSATPVRTHTAEYLVARVFGVQTLGYDVTHQLELKSLRLAAFGATTAGTGNALYSFDYRAGNVHRPMQSNWWDGNRMVIPYQTQECTGGGTDCCNDANSGSCNRLNGSAPLSLLTAVNLPANGGSYKFEYYEVGQSGNEPPDLRKTGEYLKSDSSGRLRRVIYPTGSGMQYEYKRRSYLRAFCPALQIPIRERLEAFVGVSRRQPGTKSGSQWTNIGNPWIYEGQTYEFDSEQVCFGDPLSTAVRRSTAPNEFTATTIDPSGKATVAFFSLYQGTQVDTAGKQWTPLEMGLPLSHEERDPSQPATTPAAERRYISTEVYDCSAEGFPSVTDATELANRIRRIVPRNLRNRDQGAVSSCTGPLRSTYVRFETSGTDCDPVEAGQCVHVNRRLASTRTVFRDSCTLENREAPYCVVAAPADARYAQQDYSDFDGFGHYRRAVTSGDFYAQAFPNPPGDAPAHDQRETYTAYNPTYTYTPATFTLTPALDATTRWLWSNYTFTRAVHRQSAEYRRYQFNANTGFLERMRVLENTTPPPATGPGMGTLTDSDILTVWNRSTQFDSAVGAQVLVVDESNYGGDLRPLLSVQESGVFTIPTQKDYEITRRTWLGGALHTAYRGTCGDADALVVENNTVDPVTGLLTSHQDGWGVSKNVQTIYGYDLLGRLTLVDPPAVTAPPGDTYTGEASTTLVYGNLAATVPDRTVKMRRNSGGSVIEAVHEYDGLGRLSAVQGMVEGTRTRREIGYAADGAVSTVSNVGLQGASTFHRTALTRDIFGRVLRSIPPEHNGQRVLTTYYGKQRKVMKTFGVATGIGSTSSSSTTESYDVFGRLVKVDEPVKNVENSANAVARYKYDAADRLVEVYLDGRQPARTFRYDGRGFLTLEKHPELGSYEVRHSSFDARGNAHQRLYREPSSSTQNDFDLLFDYDPAERVRHVFKRKIVSGETERRLLKEFTYAGNKVMSATRNNFIDNPLATDVQDEYAVINTYEYLSDGALASAATAAGGIRSVVSYSYDDLGNVRQLRYPEAGRFPARAVNYQYSYGMLDAICDGATSLTSCSGGRMIVNGTTYHANGLWSSIVRGNGTTDLQTIEFDYARPRSLATTAGGATLWSNDDIDYDGLGNVRQTATADRYAYDDGGRLTSASYGGGTIVQTFGYDRFGNLTSVGATRYALALTIASSTGTSDGITNRIKRLTSGSVSTVPQYDIAGNLTSWTDPRTPGETFTMEYDPLNRATHASIVKGGAQRMGRVFLYDAADERIGVVDYAFGTADAPQLRETWSIRGRAQEVLREFVKERRLNGARQPVDTWTWTRDYVYRPGTAVAEIVPGGTTGTVRHLHRDHIGSVRAITAANASVVEQRKYLPFGQRMLDSPSTSRLHFAGHERDDDGTEAFYLDLDLMHARYYASALGRFLSMDPVDGKQEQPQSWNRYVYVANNPLSMIDPDGREGGPAATAMSRQEREQQAAWDRQQSAGDKVKLIVGLQAGALAVGSGVTAIPSLTRAAGSALSRSGTAIETAINNGAARITTATQGAVDGGWTAFRKLVAATVGGAILGGTDAALSGEPVPCGVGFGAIGGFFGGAFGVSGGSVTSQLLPMLTFGAIEQGGGEACEYVVETVEEHRASSSSGSAPASSSQSNENDR